MTPQLPARVTSPDCLELATGAVALHSLSKETLARQTWWWRQWEAWAATHELSGDHLNDDTLALFLVANSDRWTAETMDGGVSSIRHTVLSSGGADPVGPVTKRLLRAIVRVQGVSTKDPTPPLSPALTSEMLVHLAQPVATPALPTIVLARHGMEAKKVARLAPEDVVPNRLGWRIAGEVTLRRADPHDQAAATALSRFLSGEHRMQCAIQTVIPTFRRAGLPPPARYGDAVEAVQALEPDAYAWLVRWCDYKLAKRLRDRAVVAVGVATARRGIELSRLNRSDIEPFEHGWLLTFRQHKTALDGREPIERALSHIGVDEQPCDAGCPACALTDWLDLLDRRWPNRPTSEAALPSDVKVAAPRGRLHPGIITGLIKATCAALSDAPQNLSSRSMRVGGATAAYQAGLPLHEIATDVTGHKDLEQLARYIRLYVPGDCTYQLPL